MRKILLAALLMVAAATVASADTLILNPVLVVHQYQQTTNNPCVIGNNSCSNPAGFDLTLFPNGGGVHSYDSVSPVYTVAQIRNIVGGNTFAIGVDINQASGQGAQQLSLFTMSINGTVVDTYSTTPGFEVPPTAGGGNGNGYADWLLTGFTSFEDLKPTDTVQFHVVMPVVNDGAEQYFLVSSSAPPAVPEPSSLALLGSGFVAAAGVIRRKYFS